MPMPPLQLADLPGLRMGHYEAGPKDAALTLVLCHGWPELAYSWRRQIPALAEAGFRVVAPDMRGFGASPGPAEVEAYDLEHLTGDLAHLLDHLGVERAVFVGHDWGGFVVWQMALRHPARTAGVIALNTAHVPRAPVDPILIYRKRFGDLMYIVQFQDSREPERIFEAHLEQTFDFFFRGPAPVVPGQRPNLAFPQIVQAYDPARDTRPALASAEERAVYVEAYRRTGFAGGINWYRNITRNWEHSEGRNEIVRAPGLMITAELDVMLPPSFAEGMEALVPDLEKHLLAGCGHWTMMERPDEANGLMIDWLKRRFG